jgi:hypothetical protein
MGPSLASLVPWAVVGEKTNAIMFTQTKTSTICPQTHTHNTYEVSSKDTVHLNDEHNLADPFLSY